MTTTLRAHFDGKVLVPDEPVELPTDCVLQLEVTSHGTVPNDPTPLERLAQIARELPDDLDLPADGAAQHDHYLYGTPKR